MYFQILAASSLAGFGFEVGIEVESPPVSANDSRPAAKGLREGMQPPVYWHTFFRGRQTSKISKLEIQTSINQILGTIGTYSCIQLFDIFLILVPPANFLICLVVLKAEYDLIIHSFAM